MRSRALAFGCLLIGGALALVASAQPWWQATGEGAAVKFTGTQATAGLSQALAIVALAGTLLMLALRTRGRRVVGALLVFVGTWACPRRRTPTAAQPRRSSHPGARGQPGRHIPPEHHRLAVDLRVCWGLDHCGRRCDHDHCCQMAIAIRPLSAPAEPNSSCHIPRLSRALEGNGCRTRPHRR